MYVISFLRGGVDVLHGTAVPGDDADPGGMFGRATGAVRAAGACTVGRSRLAGIRGAVCRSPAEHARETFENMETLPDPA